MNEEIARFLLSIFCGEAGTNQTSVFGSMKESPLYSKDPEVLSSTEYKFGWENAVGADEAPFMEDMNTLFYVLSTALKYIYQKGIPEWDAREQYFKDKSFCSKNGKLFGAKEDNINIDPEDDEIKDIIWVLLGSISDPTVSASELAKAIYDERLSIYQNDIKLTDNIVTLDKDTTVYSSIINGNVSYTFDSSNLDFSKITTFELLIDASSMEVLPNITFPTNVKWLNDEMPILEEVGVKWLFVFRKLKEGGSWFGNLQGFFLGD